MGQGWFIDLRSDLGFSSTFCIMFSTLSVGTKIAILISWGVSLCLCFHALAQLHEDSSGFIHTPHPEEVGCDHVTATTNWHSKIKKDDYNVN